MAVRKYFSTENRDSLNNKNVFLDTAARYSTYYIFDRTEAATIYLKGLKGDRVFIDGDIADYQIKYNGYRWVTLQSEDGQLIRIKLSDATTTKSVSAKLYFLDGAYTLAGKVGKIKIDGKSIPKTYVDLTSKIATNSNTAAANYFDNYDREEDLTGEGDGVVGLVQMGGTNDTLRVDAEDIGGEDTIDLKGGVNRLELVYGTDGVEIAAEELEAIGDINYLGDLDELSIENDVLLAHNSDVELAMPGEAGQVGLIEFTSVNVTDGSSATDNNSYKADMTISGTAETLTIVSAEDFNLNEGMLTVEGVTNLTVEALSNDGEIEFNVGSNLESLTVKADEEVDINISDRLEAPIELGTVYIYSVDDQGQLKVEINDDSTVTIGSLEIEAFSDADLEINYNSDSTIEVAYGDGLERETIKLSAASDADVFMDWNDKSTIRLGNVDIDGGNSHSDEAFGVYARGNEDVVIDVGTVDIDAVSDAAAEIGISDNEDSDISLGAVTLDSTNREANVTIRDNETYNDSSDSDQLPPGSLIEIESITTNAGTDSILMVSGNNDRTNTEDLLVDIGTVSLTADEDAGVLIGANYNDNIINLVSDANYDSGISIGDITVTAGEGGEDRDAVALLAIRNNVGWNSYSDDVSVTVGNVALTTNGDGEDAIALVRIDNNQRANISTGTLSLTADVGEARAELHIDDNSDAVIIVGSEGSSDDAITLNAGSDALVHIYSNADYYAYDISDGVTAEGPVSITVHGNIDVQAGDDAEMEVGYNGYGEDQTFTLTVNGDIDLTADYGNANLDFSDNDNATITVTGDVTLEGRNTGTLIVDNVGSTITIGELDQTSRAFGGEDSADADLIITYNNDSEINIDSVSLKSADDYARLYLSDNDDSEITIAGDVTLHAGEVVYSDGEIVSVTGGSYAEIEGEDHNNASIYIGASEVEGSIVRSDVNVLATNSANVTFFNNDDSDIVMGNLTLWSQNSDAEVNFSDNETSDGEDRITIDVGDVTVYAYTDANFVVYDNDGSDSDVNSINFGDVTLTSNVEDVLVNVQGNDGVDATFGDFDIEAVHNVWFSAFNGEDANLTMGDITITGADYADVYVTDVDGTEVIDITASDDTYADIEDAYDLHTLRVTGSEAEIYLVGEMGGNGEDNDSFLLDLDGMTDSFNSGADDWGNDGVTSGSVDGTFVENWQANFDGTVNVHIGSGDLIYNSYHSSWLGAAGTDWYGEDGWYSLGEDLDLSPTVERQSFNTNGFSGDQSSGTWYNATLFQTEANREFAFVSYATEDDTANWYSPGWSFYELVGSTYTLTSETAVESAMGAEITVSGGADQGNYIDGYTVSFIGSADGSSFNKITQAVYENFDSFANVIDGYPDGFETVYFTEGERATDGLGNEAREVFKFTGDSIGEIVIGGFVPVALTGVERDSDLLDFSAFALEEGVGAIRDIRDIFISVDDTDGYFSDIIIDFANQDFGSIRLVGVGQYDDASTGALNEAVLAVQNSIIFA